MNPSSQAEIVKLAQGYADESHGKMKKMLGWAVGLGVATVALVAAPLSPIIGAIALAGAVMTGTYAAGHYRAEKMMREAASEAGNSDFDKKLNRKIGDLAQKSKQATKWGVIGMVAFAVGALGAVLFPPAAPVLGMVRSLGTMFWGYNSLKSILNEASKKHGENLSEKMQEFAQKDAQSLPANDDSTSAALTKAPAPGIAFTIAVKPEALDDAPVQKPGPRPTLNL